MSQDKPDWILELTNSNVDEKFTCIIEELGSDVNRFNELPASKRHDRTFKLERRDVDSVLVGVERDDGALDPADTVCIRKKQYTFEVFRNSELKITVGLHWNFETNTCELKSQCEVLQLWQVSQRALVYLLFPYFN